MELTQRPKLKEIFEGNERLLETKEVKELIYYFEETYNNLITQYKKLEKQEFKILEQLMHSKVMLIDGVDNKTVVENCLKIHEENL